MSRWCPLARLHIVGVPCSSCMHEHPIVVYVRKR